MWKEKQSWLDSCWKHKLWAKKCSIDVKSYEEMKGFVSKSIKLYVKELLEHKSSLDSWIDIDLLKTKELIKKLNSALKINWTDIRDFFDSLSQYQSYLELLKHLDKKLWPNKE